MQELEENTKQIKQIPPHEARLPNIKKGNIYTSPTVGRENPQPGREEALHGPEGTRRASYRGRKTGKDPDKRGTRIPELSLTKKRDKSI